MPRGLARHYCGIHFLHYAVFNDSVNWNPSKSAATARDLLQRLQTAYENLSKWMQQKRVLEQGHGSMAVRCCMLVSCQRCRSTSSSHDSHSSRIISTQFCLLFILLLLLGKNTKVIHIVSTPHGMNHSTACGI